MSLIPGILGNLRSAATDNAQAIAAIGRSGLLHPQRPDRALRMGSEVVRLEQDPLRGRATAIYRDKDNRLVRVEGDFILCTLPFPVVTRLEVEPAFSGAKQRAIRELSYDSATKVLAVTRRRFWEQEEGIFGGGTYTDLPTATTWYPSDNATARDPKVSTAPAVFLASVASDYVHGTILTVDGGWMGR